MRVHREDKGHSQTREGKTTQQRERERERKRREREMEYTERVERQDRERERGRQTDRQTDRPTRSTTVPRQCMKHNKYFRHSSIHYLHI